MTRELDIYFQDGTLDEDTKVGYGFQSKLYFIDNKGTRTTRVTSQDIFNVLNIVTNSTPYTKVDNVVTPITKGMLDSLAETDEEVTSLSCTYEDSGAYIKTITLNDYDYYPLTIDCDLSKLYIMNTDKVYDLTLNIDPQTYIDDLIFFYSDTLGLDNTQLTSLIPSIYSLLTSYYSPHITNMITKRQDSSTPLYYNNLIKLSNYNNTGTLTYTLTINPDNIANLDKLGDIIGVDQDTKTLTIIPSTPFSTFPETEDSNVYISGLSETIGAETYTADGEYTCISTDTTNNTLVVKEALPFSYSFPYPKVYLQYPNIGITSVDNRTASIVVSSATGFNVGDTLTIYGSPDNVNDGEYNIVGINGTTISLDSTPPVSMTSNCGSATVLRYLAEASSIDRTNGIVTFRTPLLEVPTTSANRFRVELPDNPNAYWSYWSRVITELTTTYIKSSSILPSFTPTYPTLSYNKLAEIVNINVTSSALEELPEGEFNVDTYEQCQQYIGLGDESSYVPSTDNFEDANKQVPDNISYQGLDITVKGLYSEYYS